VATFLDYYMAHIDDVSRPFPHAVQSIDEMKAMGANITICTNKREAPARELIARLGLAARFETIVGGDTAGAPKPDPAPVRLCLERTGARRGVFVGDSDTDIRAAEASGVPMIAARFGYGPLTLGAQAVSEFEDYRGLPALVAAAANADK